MLKHERNLKLTIMVCGFVLSVTTSIVQGAGFTDITVKATPNHEVRYISGKTVYIEALVGDQWVGHYWATDGRVNFACCPPLGTDPAFQLQVKDDPIPGTNDGMWVSNGWRWVSGAEAPMTERGGRHFVVELTNTTRPLSVKVHTLLDGTPVLTRWLEITNGSAKTLALTGISPWSGRLYARAYNFKLAYQTVAMPDWISGGAIQWKSLPSGTTVVESVQGNGYDDPFFIVRNMDKGEYFIGHMAWTANYRMEFECAMDSTNPRPGVALKIGPTALDALRVIAPGETIKSPAVHLGHLAGDLDQAVQAMHEHIRKSVVPTRRPERSNLVEYVVPGDQGYYMGGDFNETNILKSIDVAAAVGAEIFILDAGWWDVYGEWTPSARRFPQGLRPLVEHAHKKGLLFGLYTEVEGGRGNWSESRVFKVHPDWFSQQNVLRLDKPEVAAYMESELTRILDEYKPDLYRHDFIPVPLYTFEGPSTLRDGFMENAYWRYYSNYYAIWDRIHSKYPDLILQMCSNGGAREDLDMLSRFHETYTLEGNVSEVFRPYSGKTLGLPPEILVFGLGNSADTGPIETLLRTTFTLSTPWILYGVAPSVEELSPVRRELNLHYANLYKNFIRPVLPTCKMFHHAPVSARGGYDSGPWFANEYAAPDRAEGWATIVRLGESESDTYVFKPRGLDGGKTYRVTFDSSGTAATVDGLRLIQEGIPVRLENVMSSELLLFQAEPGEK